MHLDQVVGATQHLLLVRHLDILLDQALIGADFDLVACLLLGFALFCLLELLLLKILAEIAFLEDLTGELRAKLLVLEDLNVEVGLAILWRFLICLFHCSLNLND